MLTSQITSWILFVSLCLAPVFAGAAAGYTGTAPVATQSDQERAAALRTALGQVVTQAAKGDAAVLRRPEIARALTRPERYVRQYSYQPNNAPAEPGKTPAKFLLVAQFDAVQIDALVRDQTAAAAPAAVPPAPTSAASAVNAAPVPGAAAAAPVTAATGAEPTTRPSDAVTNASAGYRLWFSGLRSAEDYARLIGGLNANAEVRTLRIEQAHGNVLQARIEARSSLQNLTDALAAARLAHATGTQPPVEGVDAVLDFEP